MKVSKVGMQKACISCQNFTCKGFAFNDQHKKEKYGNCSKFNKGVFATEICAKYIKEPEAEIEHL